jgi:hypothetical protein
LENFKQQITADRINKSIELPDEQMVKVLTLALIAPIEPNSQLCQLVVALLISPTIIIPMQRALLRPALLFALRSCTITTTTLLSQAAQSQSPLTDIS